MHTITSFHSSDVHPDRLNAIMADYMALERVRVFRRVFVTRFGLLALAFAAIGAGLGVLPAFATWFSVGVPDPSGRGGDRRAQAQPASCTSPDRDSPRRYARGGADAARKKVIKSS